MVGCGNFYSAVVYSHLENTVIFSLAVLYKVFM